MKGKILLIFALLFSMHSFADTEKSSVIGQYQFIQVINIVSCKADGSKDDPVVLRQTYIDQYFNVINVVGSDAIIQFVDYKLGDPNIFQYTFKGTPTEYDKLDATAANMSEFGDKQFFFKIPLQQLEDFAARKIKGSPAIGVINYPFKLRLQPGKQDFSGSFNFGAAIGYTFEHRSDRDWTLSILSGYSISNLNIDSAAVNKHKPDLQATNNFTAFSISIGAMFTYHSKVQVGIFMGTDRLSRLNQQYFDWIYQGNPWFSVGFGYSIFSIGDGNQKPKTQQSSN